VDEADVALVERAHGRHEADRPGRAGEGHSSVPDGPCDDHGETSLSFTRSLTA